MSRLIFVNLPVKDLSASRGFFEALGFSTNEQFSDDKAACVVLDDNIFVMLLREEFFRTFVGGEVADAWQVTEVLTCLSAESRQEVDDLVRRAVEAGGKPWKESFSDGPMYGGSFQDLDGHVWEVMHMDLPGSQG
ncbi:VOC family protein [Knoellia sp. p5-6-4]|uniref:VOC family protein n=1 Tax=unclassified Knoellia TaxID=2618719 RepID=UPI0023DB1C6B|nr:VOC family protein [Knoellia sp. p5-6-4]MDF2144785.1 VOC family protein [Knoellia sp. p5-6-4]